jgi:SAM-dependent methyltransferase
MNQFRALNFNNEPMIPDLISNNPNFLQEQIRLPRNQWDEIFRQLIEEKTRENQRTQEGINEDKKAKESSEILRKKTFERYIKGLGLSEESLRGKRILDLGCGSGEFVQYLIENGITLEAYGIDMMLDESAIEDKFKKHFIKGNFEKDFPVKGVDYVISVGAVSNGIWGGEEVMDIRRIIKNSVDSLNENGEIRIYPLQEAAEATPLSGLKASKEKWQRLFEEISQTQKLEFEIRPIDVRVSGKNNDIILESVLIIRKKKG